MDRQMSLGASAASTCAIPSASLSIFLPIATRREARDLQRQWRASGAGRHSRVEQRPQALGALLDPRHARRVEPRGGVSAQLLRHGVRQGLDLPGVVCRLFWQRVAHAGLLQLADRKSTRLNSSHRCISYAVFCLKKKNSAKNLQCAQDKKKHLTRGSRSITDL